MHARQQTFRAPDARSALAAVKAALGPNAVIVSTRQVTAGLLRRPELEVVAKLDPPLAASRAATPGVHNSGLAAHAAASSSYTATQSATHAAPSQATAPREAPSGLSASAKAGSDRRVHSDLAMLRRALDDTRSHLASLTREVRGGRTLDLPPSAGKIFARLLAAGVEELLAEELLQQAALSAGDDSLALEAATREILSGYLVADHAPWLPRGRYAGGKTNIIALVGPTGVGKTTTIAKIAARAGVESKLKVGLVTVDNYRIGAKEQLARYANLMHIPIKVARDRNELSRAMTALRDRDLILIDTAGRSSLEDVHTQAKLVRSVKGAKLNLVLSIANGARHLSELAERFLPLEPERVIFSKLDETRARGGALSALMRIKRPVSCLTCGQRVPEDLDAATTESLLALVLGPSATDA